MLYELFLFLVFLLLLPKVFFERFFYGKHRGLLRKFFFFQRPIIKRGARKTVLMHAVSVGETKALSSLITHLKAQDKSLYFVVTSCTETGHMEAKRSLDADEYLFLPFDFSWNMKRLLSFVKPSIILISETDFWYNFLRKAKQNNARIILVNGKISKRSAHLFTFFFPFSKRLFSFFDQVCVQNELYAERFKKFGVCPAKIKITGNLKLDNQDLALSVEELQKWRLFFGLTGESKVITVASTHENEEELILTELRKVQRTWPKLKILLAPRHPERFKAVEKILQANDFDYVLFSKYKEGDKSPLVLIDTMGFLRVCFQLSDLALVGGSFINIGGHNILEPILMGVPAIFGSYMHAQPDLKEIAVKYKCGKVVLPNEIAPFVNEFYENDNLSKEMKANCLAVKEKVRGALPRTLEVISPFLDKKVL